MRKILLTLAAVLPFISIGQNNPYGTLDPNETRYFAGKPYDPIRQQDLRSLPQWQEFLDAHGTWYVHFNERTGLPHRGYGSPIPVSGANPTEMALSFAEGQLSQFDLPIDELISYGKEIQGKYNQANFRQYHNGLLVIGSRYTVKFHQNKVIMFGCDIHNNIEVEMQPTISDEQAAEFAKSNITNEILTTMTSAGLKILPVPHDYGFEYHLVYEVMVRTLGEDNVPANYQTYIDANSGEVLSRTNKVLHIDPRKPSKSSKTNKSAPAEEMLQVTATVTGEVHENNPTEPTVAQDLENIYITVGSVNYQADENGTAEIPVDPGTNATIRLMGPWCRVYTDNTTPTMSVTLQDGQNNFSFNSNSNVKERSAYRSVQAIHDFQKFWMPNFDGMDFQLTTNIDVEGTCNAFYDGESINFFDLGGGCNASSLVADVCHHEYGHGINDFFYQSNGGFFVNGAMGEGYADFWALSLNNNPLLGVGFNTADVEPIRRYDIDPKVYPTDLVGQVHADGEIIMGAWWDSHLLMGADWNITMPIFVEAYSGMQAETANGNEGEAYTDVLIDALQADDDDGDITNGTPNGNEIVEGFYLHGITLLSNAEIIFSPIPFHNAESELDLEITLELEFPFTQYLAEMSCFYKINAGQWVQTPMESDNNANYLFELPGQEAGTVVAHYFGAFDTNGLISGVVPKGAHLDPFPNLPYFTLIGVTEVAAHDCDDNANFGMWQTGIVGDNATTGEWEEDEPMASYTTDIAAGTMVQPGIQTTPGGEFCFITGNASNTSAGIGENDVDNGKTTLQSPIIDMSELIDPIIAYNRWYTNNPPGGANPGQDYWQVRISDNGGDTWTYVENTKTSDMSWRRNAFHVSDFVEVTNEMRFQFIASDSANANPNIENGSLIEAAMDDFIIYDALIIGVDESEQKLLSVYPNPASGVLNVTSLRSKDHMKEVQLISQKGEMVDLISVNNKSQNNTLQFDISRFAAGSYTLRIITEQGEYVEQIQIIK
jgi:Zn-dependent metalloprotease